MGCPSPPTPPRALLGAQLGEREGGGGGGGGREEEGGMKKVEGGRRGRRWREE